MNDTTPTEQDQEPQQELKPYQQEREQLIEEYGALENAPYSVIVHFENYRERLEQDHTRPELKRELAQELDMGLMQLNEDYGDIIDNEDLWDYELGLEPIDYLSEKALAQLVTQACSIRRTGSLYKGAYLNERERRAADRENYFFVPKPSTILGVIKARLNI